MNCPVERRMIVTRGKLNIVTGVTTPETTSIETRACDSPLFSHEREAGICRSCLVGWSTEGNAPTERGLQQIADAKAKVEAKLPEFEMHGYGADDDGRVASTPAIIRFRARDNAAAKGRAGRLAKAIKGPVDLARAGDDDWSDRYMTTASPSDVHASGYRFERID